MVVGITKTSIIKEIKGYDFCSSEIFPSKDWEIQYYLKDKEKKTNGKCNTVFTQRS